MSFAPGDMHLPLGLLPALTDLTLQARSRAVVLRHSSHGSPPPPPPHPTKCAAAGPQRPRPSRPAAPKPRRAGAWELRELDRREVEDAGALAALLRSVRVASTPGLARLPDRIRVTCAGGTPPANPGVPGGGEGEGGEGGEEASDVTGFGALGKELARWGGKGGGALRSGGDGVRLDVTVKCGGEGYVRAMGALLAGGAAGVLTQLSVAVWGGGAAAALAEAGGGGALVGPLLRWAARGDGRLVGRGRGREEATADGWGGPFGEAWAPPRPYPVVPGPALSALP